MLMSTIFNEINDMVKYCGPLLAGLDPDVDHILDIYEKSGEAQESFSYDDGEYMIEDIVYDFCVRYIDAIKDVVCAIKINSAFFENRHLEQLYIDICKIASDEGLYVIADVKRADIGNTSLQYANAYLGKDVPIDCITVNPYFGFDGIKPFLDLAYENNKGVFVLVKTSNPSSDEIQDQELKDGSKLYQRVMENVQKWASSYPDDGRYSMVGAVVGATQSDSLTYIRKQYPEMFFLAPGFGAQGAGINDVLLYFDECGGGALVNSSRGLMFAVEKAPYNSKYGYINWDLATKEEAKRIQKEFKEALNNNSLF
jgi:orotidine-5'-phosphate decarboxylase